MLEQHVGDVGGQQYSCPVIMSQHSTKGKIHLPVHDKGGGRGPASSQDDFSFEDTEILSESKVLHRRNMMRYNVYSILVLNNIFLFREKEYDSIIFEEKKKRR